MVKSFGDYYLTNLNDNSTIFLKAIILKSLNDGIYTLNSINNIDDAMINIIANYLTNRCAKLNDYIIKYDILNDSAEFKTNIVNSFLCRLDGFSNYVYDIFLKYANTLYLQFKSLSQLIDNPIDILTSISEVDNNLGYSGFDIENQTYNKPDGEGSFQSTNSITKNTDDSSRLTLINYYKKQLYSIGEWAINDIIKSLCFSYII